MDATAIFSGLDLFFFQIAVKQRDDDCFFKVEPQLGEAFIFLEEVKDLVSLSHQCGTSMAVSSAKAPTKALGFERCKALTIGRAKINGTAPNRCK